MLDVIGAGATATSDRDWHNDVWKKSPEAQAALEEIDRIHAEGRNRPPVKEELHSEYSTTWLHQVRVLIIRNARFLWRSPIYIFAKVFLNVMCGLLVGFTFFKSPSTLQGTQDKLFSVFSALIVSVPAAQQLQVPFIAMRTIYEVRERPSKMYGWSAWVTSQLVMELPWNIFCGTIFFLCWYWTVGFPTSRGGYTYLMLSVLLPIYYTTIGQAVAAMSPTPEVSGLIFTSIFNFVLLLCVVYWFSDLYHDSRSDLAMVSCSHSGHWVGGSGCIEYLHTHTSLKAYRATVSSLLSDFRLQHHNTFV